LIGISVERIQGINAEKNKIVEIDSEPIIKRVCKLASKTINEGKNMSIKLIAAAFAAISGSGICRIHVNG
jgi:hypothetical protein